MLFFHKTLCFMEKALRSSALPALCQKAQNTSHMVSDAPLAL